MPEVVMTSLLRHSDIIKINELPEAALDSRIQIMAPWRDPEFTTRFQGRVCKSTGSSSMNI